MIRIIHANFGVNKVNSLGAMAASINPHTGSQKHAHSWFGVFSDPTVQFLTVFVFSNRHGVCEDYIKYCHFCETYLKNIDDYILLGSRETPEPSIKHECYANFTICCHLKLAAVAWYRNICKPVVRKPSSTDDLKR